jgi:hypothetical protein
MAGALVLAVLDLRLDAGRELQPRR